MVEGLRKNCGRYKNSQTKYTPLPETNLRGVKIIPAPGDGVQGPDCPGARQVGGAGAGGVAGGGAAAGAWVRHELRLHAARTPVRRPGGV